MKLLAVLFGLFLFLRPGLEPVRAQTLQPVEITMAAPDILAVELRDPPFGRGGIVTLDQPRGEAIGTWVDVDGQWGLVTGPQHSHLRLADTPPSRFLDRDAADSAEGYRLDGKPRIRAVHRLSMPYDSGIFRGPDGGMRTGASMRHQIYLKLDRALEPGVHRLSFPGDLAAPQTFTFDPKATRALAIRMSQIGQTPDDASRKAYLSLWLPGGAAEGAVDFRAYGIDRFAILDKEGRQVFEAAIRLRSTPQTPERSNGLASPLLDRARAGGKRFAIASIDQGSGRPWLAVPGHAFRDGDRVLLERLGGEQDAGAVAATVADATAAGFALTSLQGHLPDRIEAGASVVLAHRINRAGTFVFELDYGAWRPRDNGPYRLHVPGLGVGDPFVVSTDAWLGVARTMMGGLYNHRSGVALDGRFGYRRPVAFRPGAQFVIRESSLPLSWSSEAPDGGFVPFAEGAKPAFLSDRIAPESYWGGYMDAGDWDRRIQHLDIANLMLTLLEEAPQGGLPERLGLPASSAALGDPRFAMADDLPDLLQESLWGVEFYRRLQLADGRVRGGIESDEHPLLGSASYLEHRQVFAYAPDPMSAFIYAATAGRLARVLKAYGKPDLAALYAASAHAAWTAGEQGYANPDGAYADAIAAGERAGLLAGVPWSARRQALQEKTQTYRAAAAASLLRLDGRTGHRQVIEAALAGNWDLYMHKGDAAWDYARSEGADPALRGKVERLILEEAQLVVSTQADNAYPSMKHPYAPAGWGQGGPPDYSQAHNFIRAHRLGGNPAILGLMEDTLRGLTGANQTGLSLITGLGARPVRHPLHEDHRAMGVDAPAGIAIFGWAPQEASAYGWVFGPPWSPLAETGSGENAPQRRIHPDRWSLPVFEYLVEHPGVIIQQEYTVHQTIAPVAAIALYLQAVHRGGLGKGVP